MLTGAPETKVYGRSEGKVVWRLISNADVMLWPPWSEDWQEDYDFAGHRHNFRVSEFKRFAQQLGLPKEEIEAVCQDAESPGDVDSLKVAEKQGIEPSQATNEKKTAVVPVWELWGHRPIAGVPFPVSFYCFYTPRLRKILWTDLNRNYNGQHPYFPLRYKQVDQSAWGNGIGHEVLHIHNIDTAFLNLEVDDLMAAVFSVQIVRSGSLAETQTSSPTRA